MSALCDVTRIDAKGGCKRVTRAQPSRRSRPTAAGLLQRTGRSPLEVEKGRFVAPVDPARQPRYGADGAMSKGSAAQTPVMRQYLSAKAAHPDALLLFRMGDFYELFFEDAVVAARALDLTLTARNKGSDDEIPMAGVPHHAASAYVQKLLEQGFNVAICEQMADPSKIKGIVPREVVRVVTPGIVYDDAGLEARQNHYLVAVERN
jgi:hypothetical protein